MAFCSSQAVSPLNVTDDVLQRFGTELAASGELDKPNRKVGETIGAWNKLCAMAAPMNLPTLSVPPKRTIRWTITPQRFPSTFQRDVAGWRDRLTNVDLEAEDGLT